MVLQVGITSLLTLTEIGNTDVDHNFTLCLAMTGLMSTPCIVTFLIMTAIAVDRYMIIFKPFRSTENEIRKVKSLKLAILTTLQFCLKFFKECWDFSVKLWIKKEELKYGNA